MLEDYQLGEAGKVLQEFVWSEFCDWYIEAAKDLAQERQRNPARRNLPRRPLRAGRPSAPPPPLHALPNRRAMAEPPRLAQQRRLACSLSKEHHDGPVAHACRQPMMRPSATSTLVMEIIREIRNARAEAVRDAPENIKKEMTGRRIEAHIAGGSRTAMLKQEADTIARLARLDPAKLTIDAQLSPADRPDKATTLVVGDTEVVLPLAGLVDLDAEKKRLQTEAEQTEAEIERTQALLANEGFIGRAPANVVERERAKLASAQERLPKLRERLALL